MTNPRSSPVLDVLAGLALRCPNCHKGRMYRAFSDHMHDTCGVCGVAFERARGEFTGAMMFMMGITGLIALMGWFVLYVLVDAPAWLTWGWLVFFAIVFPVGFYRNVKGAWIGVVHAGAGLRVPSSGNE